VEWIINWKNGFLQSWKRLVKCSKHGLDNQCSHANSNKTADHRSRQTLKEIITKTYHSLVLPDGDTNLQNYIISKKTYFPERTIGADFCAVKEIDNGILILFGDAAGHGVIDSVAAIICMTVFNAITSEDPMEILRKINKVLCITRDKAYCVCIRIQNDEIFYCGRIEEAILSNRPFDMNCSVLGASEVYECESKVAKFEDHDVLRLRTDGAFFDDKTDDQMEVIIRKEGTILPRI
jgi:hypothetical protein